MRTPMCVLILAAWALAEDSQDRRSKLPFIADAVGNTLPPPSMGPATVGSPVNLLTPDRYEFYTFDESGELVKRLMTLEEIQAIVAAGEETESLVTFANDNQPTIAFNFSQPPYTKVHSVVSNVQNVLKAQMEAHKNKPQTQLPLDTPDVSDSWSLILPSIFGNTGVDIIPDKTSGSFITPETDTIDLDTANFEEDNYFGKEGTNAISTSLTTGVYEKIDKKPIAEKYTTEKLISTPDVIMTTTTIKSTASAERRRPTVMTTTTTSSTTSKPRMTTTIKPPVTYTTTVKSKPILTTNRPIRTTPIQHKRISTPVSNISTHSPLSEKSSTTVVITRRPVPNKFSIIDGSSEVPNTVPLSFGAVLDSRKPGQHEKVSTLFPASTVTYITDSTTRKPLVTTKVTSVVNSTIKRATSLFTTTSQPKIQSSTIKPYSTTTSYFNSISEQEYNINSTTITTQSVSPSTTISSTEFINVNNQQEYPNKTESIDNISDPGKTENVTNDDKENEPILPLFDVAQSISQIASDLGGNYSPLPTSTNLLDTTKQTTYDVESKENLEIEIPTDNENEHKTLYNKSTSDNFIKIPTLTPNENNNKSTINELFHKNDNNLKDQSIEKQSNLPLVTLSSIVISSSTTIDPVLSESMEDLLSQIVHSVPESIVSNNISNIIKHEKVEVTQNNNPNKNVISLEVTPETFINTESSTSGIETIRPDVEDKNDNNLPLTNKIGVSQKKNNTQNSNNYQIKSKLKNSTIVDIQRQNQNKIDGIINSSSNVETTQTSFKIPESEVYSENKNNTSLTTAKNYRVESTTSTELFPKLESTTIRFETTTRQKVNNTSNIEKSQFLSTDKNNLLNKNQKVKEPLIYLKVEEFKKKIQKVNIDDKELANERNNSWKLISTVSPHIANELNKERHKNDVLNSPEITEDKNIILDFSKENQGLEVTTKDLSEDVAQFTELCNELAFQYWIDVIKDIDKKRSFVLSPYSITSMLAMMFMGARGSTSGEMNEILKLDDMVTFNPHFILKNISDSIETSSGSGVAISAFIRELYSDRSKGKILTFYKERAQQFYNGHVEEINFKLISDIVRRRTNLLVKRYTWGKILEYMKTNNIIMNVPLAAFSANIFQTDCSSSSVEGRDGEMYFVVSPNVRQRRLVPVPAVVYKSNFLAGYDPVLDATAAALGNTNSVISTLFLMPGQQGNVVHAEDLEALERRLLDSRPLTPTWNRLLRTLLPRVGLELQIPRFSHKSIFNVSSTLRRMGLKDLFDREHADLGGLNGPSKDLYLSDMIQTTTFVTCGEGIIAEQHHIEEYPEILDSSGKRRTARWVAGWDEPRDYQRAFHDPHDVGEALHLPLHLRPRQARLPSRSAQPARLKFDRPFIFFVRHNPSGMILYVGRYNPRLLP